MPKIPSPALATHYIGIDPGKKGGIACITPNDKGTLLADTWEMPEGELDLWKIFQELSGLMLMGTMKACIEHVTASPQAGVTSMFTFGYGYGRLRMGLMAIGVSHQPVRPQVWQKAMNISPRKRGEMKGVDGVKVGFKKVGGEKDREFKERLRLKAQQLFPNLEVWNSGIGKQLAISDALLIAEYCRRVSTGVLVHEDQ